MAAGVGLDDGGGRGDTTVVVSELLESVAGVIGGIMVDGDVPWTMGANSRVVRVRREATNETARRNAFFAGDSHPSPGVA